MRGMGQEIGLDVFKKSQKTGNREGYYRCTYFPEQFWVKKNSRLWSLEDLIEIKVKSFSLKYVNNCEIMCMDF